jgi:hypothetical protein
VSIWDGLFGRRRVKLTDPASWHLDSGSWSGKAVTPDSVLQLATAWACVRLNSRTIGSLPLKVYERVSAGRAQGGRHHPLYDILHDTPERRSDGDGVLGGPGRRPEPARQRLCPEVLQRRGPPLRPDPAQPGPGVRLSRR